MSIDVMDILNWSGVILAVVFSLSVHEYCHALVATKLGDPTPRQEGRLSLNPIRHIDPIGFIVMVLIKFGWAKPVRVNPLWFKDPKKGMLLTAVAGPVSNLCLCVPASLLFYVFSYSPISYGYMFISHGESPIFYITVFLYYLFGYMTLLNIGLAVFNLIPIHPLDGSRILSYFVPSYANFMARNGSYVQLGFMALLIFPRFLPIPNIFGIVIGTVQNGISGVLEGLWSLIFRF